MMNAFYEVGRIVLPAFALIALGYLVQRNTGGDSRILSRLTMNLFVPAFAFKHIYEMRLEDPVIGPVLISAILIILIPGLLAWPVLRNETKKGIFLPIMFMNSVNLPFPIFLAAFGPSSIPYALMFYLAAFVGIFTLGLFIASGGSGGPALLVREPVSYVLLISGALNALDVVLPEIVLRPVVLMEGATIPLVLIVLGMHLAGAKITELRLSLTAVGFRLVGGALAGLACVALFDLTGLARKVVLLEAVMPSAVINLLVADKYGTNPRAVASAILISTLISAFILPLALILI